MSLKIGGHLFTGPFPIDKTEVRANQVPVVYAVIVKKGHPWAPSHSVLAIGFSEDSGLRFADHPSAAQWQNEKAVVYLYYAPRSRYSRSDRQRLASEIGLQYSPPRNVLES